MKTFKTYGRAVKASNGQPIIRIGWHLYVVGIRSLDEVSLIASDNRITGHVTMAHLDRLGNANWAIAKDKDYAFGRAFKDANAITCSPECACRDK